MQGSTAIDRPPRLYRYRLVMQKYNYTKLLAPSNADPDPSGRLFRGTLLRTFAMEEPGEASPVN